MDDINWCYTDSLNASILGEKIKYTLYEELEKLPDEWVVAASFIAAPALALITLLTKVLTIVEIVFNAISNTFYACFFSEDPSFHQGFLIRKI